MLDQIDVTVIIPLSQCGFTTAILIVFCYLGALTTESFEKYFDCVFESQWYYMNVEQQKIILFMIQNYQKLRLFHGFRLVYLDLVTFRTVNIKTDT